MPNRDDFYNHLKFDLKSPDSVFMDHWQGVVGFSACKKWELTDRHLTAIISKKKKSAYSTLGQEVGKHENNFQFLTLIG